MDKDTFIKLSIEKQIEFFNSEMSLGKSASQISRELGYADESSNRKRFKNNGYVLNASKSAYIQSDDTSMIKVSTPKKVVQNKPITKIKSNDDKSMINVTTIPKEEALLPMDEKLKANLLKLVTNYDDIQTMLEWFKNKPDDNDMTNVIEVIQGIKIDIPPTKSIRTTIRINEGAWNIFNEFSDKHKEFSKQDLMAMALIEYVNKYK